MAAADNCGRSKFVSPKNVVEYPLCSRKLPVTFHEGDRRESANCGPCKIVGNRSLHWRGNSVRLSAFL